MKKHVFKQFQKLKGFYQDTKKTFSRKFRFWGNAKRLERVNVRNRKKEKK